MHRMCLCAAQKELHYFDVKLTSDAKIQPAITWSRDGHGLRPISMLWLVKLGQVSPCGKFMQHLETCLPTAEADRISCRHLVMFLTVFFHRMYKSKYSCYQDSSVIRGWVDYWVFGPGMRRLPKSLETQFRMSSFSLFTLFDAKEG